MPRRFAPRQPLTISQKVKIGGGGEIRTRGPHIADIAFRERPVQPLRHSSLVPILASKYLKINSNPT